MSKKVQQRQQQTSQAYSPEYSSPFSSNSVLQARFSKGLSPRNTIKFGPTTKENFVEEPLPVFQELNTSNEQMIPQVTVNSCELEENQGTIGGGGAILSDFSDELLIKQLQLQNVDEKDASAAFQSSTNFMTEKSPSKPTRGVPLQEKQNLLSSPSRKQTIYKNNSPNSMLKQSQSPVKHNFLQKGGRSPGPKSNQVGKKTKTSTVEILPAPRRNKPNRNINSGAVLENIEYAPVPHPYPVPQYIMSEITDTFDESHTGTTKKIEASPAIMSQDERLYNFNNGNQLINTDSSNKQDTRMLAWSASASPATAALPATQNGLNYRDNVIVHEFAENSTIEEQPTNEQASHTVTMLTNNRQNHNATNPSSIVMKTNTGGQGQGQGQGFQQKVSTKYTATSAVCDESVEENEESLEQIRLINQVIEKKLKGDFSAEQRSHNASDSLKDFSLGQAEAGVTISNEFYKGAPLLDFENSYKNQTSAMNTISHVWQDPVSMAVQKDSAHNLSISQKQLAMTHFIQTNMQQMDDAGRIPSTMPQRRPDSTLLNINDRSPEKSKQSLAEQCKRQQQLQHHRQQQPIGKSPNQQTRAKVYGQCQITPDELYKPVLRNVGGMSGGKKMILQPEMATTSGSKMPSTTKAAGPAMRLDFGTEITPSKPFQYATKTNRPQNAANNGFESRIPSIRRNFNSNTKTSSVSPASRLTSSVKPITVDSMLQKYGLTNRIQARGPLPTTTPATRKELNNSPIPQISSQYQRDRFNNNAAILSQSVKNRDLMGQMKQSQQPQQQPLQNRLSTQSNKNHTPVQNMSRNPFARLKHNLSNSPAVNVRPNKPNQSNIITTTAAMTVASQKSTTPKARSPKPRTPAAQSTTPKTFSTIADMNSRKRFAAFEGVIQQKSHERLRSQQNRSPTPSQTKASPYQLRRVTDSLKKLDIQTFLEIERIKKPSAAILAIARMSCTFFEVMRNRDSVIMDQVETMTSWHQIQEYMRTQLTCCVPELRTLLKQKITTLGRLNGEDAPKETEIESLLGKLYEKYFTDTKIRVISRFIQSSKLMKSLVQLIFSFVCLGLNLEREFKLDNILGLKEQPPLQQSRNDEFQSRVAYKPALKSQQSNHSKTKSIKSSTSQLRASRASRASNKSRQVEKSRDRSQEQQNKTINNDQSNSCCSKCTCHMKQNASSHNSIAISSKKSLHQSRKSMKSPLAQQNPLMFVEQNKYIDIKKSQSFLYSSNQLQVPMTMPIQALQKSIDYTNNTPLAVINHQAMMEDDADLVNVMSQRALSPPAMTITQNMASLAEQHINAQTTVQEKYENPISQGSTTPSSAAGRKANRQIVGFFDTKPQQVKTQVIPTPVKEVLRRGKRKSTTQLSMGGSDFASVVRASVNKKSPVNRQTANSKMGTQKLTVITPKGNHQVTAMTSRHLKSKSSSANQYALAPKKKEDRAARTKDVSPVTPNRRQNQILSKVPSSLTTISQSKVSQPLQKQTGRHQRTSTLYKATASTQARLVQVEKSTLSKSPLSRATSAKAFTPNAKSTSQPQVQRKTKQMRMKAKEAKFKAIVQQSDVDQFMMMGGVTTATMTFQGQKPQETHRTAREYQNPGYASFQAPQEHVSAIETVPNFGGVESYQHEVKTEDMIDREMTKQATRGSLQIESFTRHNQDSFMQQQIPELNIPVTTQSKLEDSPSITNRYTTSEKRCYEHMMQDSLNEPSCAIDCHQPNDERKEFILQQAQAITENINSCYKSHNLPQIDMTTIDRLKMRRMQFMKEQNDHSDNSDEIQHENHYRGTQQSCNVMTTKTVETYQTETQQTQGEAEVRQQDVSFTEALNKLKAEVESLMLQRINK